MAWLFDITRLTAPKVQGVLLALSVTAAIVGNAAAAFKFVKPGLPLPEFTLRTLDDREITLEALKSGGPGTLLVFWASWSPRSETALHDAQALAERYGAKGLRALAVNVNRQETGLHERALIEKTLGEWKITLPQATDPGLAASSSFGLVANPSVALLDAKGVLVYESSGWSRAASEACREAVENLLGVRTAPAPAPAAAPLHQPERKALLYFNLARNLLRQGERSKAMETLQSAAEADAAWAPPRALLAHHLLQQRTEASLIRAGELFGEAVRLDPADVSAASGLGETLLLTGRAQDAAAEFKRALALEPTYTPAIAGHALALARLGKEPAALELFEAALALNPREPAIYAGRAECREIGGNLAAAAADYRQAAEILLGVR
jgi:tetratricopeptide (TPR) repeat protein